MDPLELLQYAAATFERLEIPYLVTGSMATMTYGEPRFTNDIDIIADLKPSHVEPLCEAFPVPDYYCSGPAIEEAIRRRSQFNVIRPASGLKIDVMVPADTEFNRSRFSRGNRITIDEQRGEACFVSPEDAILKKLEYFREGGSDKHVRDIHGVLSVQGDTIDFDYIQHWAERLQVVDQLREIQDSR